MASMYERTLGVHDEEKNNYYMFADGDVRDLLESGTPIPRLTGENSEITVGTIQETVVHSMMKSAKKSSLYSSDRIERDGREYPVGRDADGNMSVNVPWVNTTYDNASLNASGLMSKEDKKKLENLEKNVGDIGSEMSDLGSFVNKALTEMIKVIYPIGSIYMTTMDTNPGELFEGTTWMRWGAGKVPVGVDYSDSLFNSVEKTGGSKNNELVRHSHGMSGGTISEASGEQFVELNISESGRHVHQHTTMSSVDLKHSHSGTTANAGTHKHAPGTLAAVTHTAEADISFSSLKTDGNLSGIPGYKGVNPGFRDVKIGDTYKTADHNYEKYMVGETADAGNHNHTFSTSNALASHNHTLNWDTSDGGHSHTGTATVSLKHSHTLSGVKVQEEGYSSGVDKNLQPYITCFMWKRTA